MATITQPTQTKPQGRRAAPRRFVSEDGLLAVKDWLALSEVKPRYELVQGKLVQKKVVGFGAVHATGNFLLQCHNSCEQQGWHFFPQGTGVYVDNHTGYVPDIVGFAPDTEIDPVAVVTDAPNLVAEVLSPWSTSIANKGKKLNYAKIGVELYVLIDPATKQFEAYRLEGQKYGAPEILSQNEVWQPAELHGLRLELAQLWM